jgi:aspartyl-tRNA(Asn)/glutamyl-tRNA(Gln) amidotransferase subunit B
MEYEAVIGLEVHVQLKTEAKMFCGCSTAFGSAPNTQVCPVCMGYPGVLPVINEKAVLYTIKTGLMTGCEIALFSKFDRKNYFYPDLPKDYQISQFDKPLAKNGSLEIDVDGVKKVIGITRIHLEEDAGKLFHLEDKGVSGVDFNRTGIPLMEIVSEPDMRTPDEAFWYLKAVRQIITYLDVSDCNMEEGSLRCDANVSVRPKGEQKFGTKTEVKNMNSFTNVKRALAYEIERLIKLTDAGERIVQETRLWDADAQKTFSMRSKEEAHDYRYFPEPDLVPMTITEERLGTIRAELPEMPDARRRRYMEEYGLSDYAAGVMTCDKGVADYFEACLKLCPAATAAANWIMGDLMRDLNAQNIAIHASPVTPQMLAEMITLIENGTISGKIAKDVFAEMFTSRKNAETIVREKGLVQITDEGEIAKLVKDVLAKNPSSVADYRGGKAQALGFLVGQVMKLTKGKANPKVVNTLLVKEIGS